MTESKLENLGITNITIVIKVLGNLGGIDSIPRRIMIDKALLPINFLGQFDIFYWCSWKLTNINEIFYLNKRINFPSLLRQLKK